MRPEAGSGAAARPGPAAGRTRRPGSGVETREGVESRPRSKLG